MKLHGVAASFAAAGGAVRAVDGRDQLDLGASARPRAVAAGMVSVFAAGRRADGTPGRRVYLGTVAPGGVLPGLAAPLAGASHTVVAVPEGKGTVVEAPDDRSLDEPVADATEAFARVMLPFDDRGTVPAAGDALPALLAHVADAVRADAQAIAEAAAGRSRQQDGLRARYARMLGAVFSRQDEVLAVDPNLPPMLRACRHLAVEAGVPLSAIPRRIPDDPLLAAPEAFAHAARIGCRHVRLPDRWWRSDVGALLAVLPDGTPIALVPGRWGGYRAFAYEPGAQSRPRTVDAAYAASLPDTAISFAPPLPASATSLRALGSFLLAGSTHDLGLAVGVSMVASILNLAVPFATGILVSKVIPGGRALSLVHLGAVLASTILSVAACELVVRIMLLRAETRATTRGSSAIVQRALQLPLSFFQRHSVGDLAERLGAIEELQRRVTGNMVVSVVGGVFSLTYLALMAAIDPVAALVSAAAFAAILAFTALIARRQSRFAADAAERSGRLSGFALQLLGGIDRIRTTGTEEHALMQWLQRYRPERRAMYAASMAGAQLRVLGICLPFASAAFLWWRFGAGKPGSEQHVAEFMAFNAAFAAALAGITALGCAMGDISEALPLVGRLRPILEERPESDPGADVAGRLSGGVALQNVRFAHPGSPGEVLRGVSLEVGAGEFVALVGASGSGKSTLVQILLGLRRPTVGKVLFDGKDLARLDLVSVRRQIGVVAQHGRVIPGTIMENIVGATLLGPSDAWEAAEAAGLADDIRDMPMQMQTFVNEHTLSGGQLQKLLIARALVTRPRILVFDEATSSLDEVSQAHVSRSLAERSVTRIVVAHRLSTVRGADRIHVLADGAVVQTGRFDELAAEDGPFRELVRRQLLETPAPAGGAA